ncbi:MAG: hypothetical protein HYX41_08200 [Bdellovibrio sp.]|nr:hypothetical protein [Bdellovibrio sp.]
MVERYSFIPIFTLLMGGAAWWSTQVGPMGQGDLQSKGGIEASTSHHMNRRRELIEFLDRAVTFERYFHSYYQRYSSNLQKTGLRVPVGVKNSYDLRVSDVGSGKVLITASGRPGSDNANDLVSINQDYDLQANFKIPPPRPVYLKMHALKQLRLLKDAPPGQSVEEQGVYKGFFKYTNRSESEDDAVVSLSRVVSARGVRPPVAGVLLELNNQNQAKGSDLETELSILSEQEDSAFLGVTSNEDVEAGAVSSLVNMTNNSEVTGERNESSLTEGNPLEEARLAQEIFRGEIGRYAKSWLELSRIVHFKFSAKEKMSAESVTNLRNAERKLGTPGAAARRSVSSVQGAGSGYLPVKSPPANQHGLEIEAVEFDETQK